ncbi:MAG: MogA/MoaB family molybdenum cofactor biosynthesis protein [Deltaproteobacteria bacterium]|nr:MogA/MoaB family molybdenum cofactor biosynthesis protein [Deltaproteobacteria bacterium]
MGNNDYRIGVLTLSDKGSRGERVDESGRLLAEMVAELGEVARYQIIPDDLDTIIMMLKSWSDDLHLDLILTTGGTGLSPRDCAPQATQAVINYPVPGMAEAMRSASMKITPRAMLSRALVGVRNQTLIINLPGSPKGVRENLAVLLPVLPHALEKLNGSPADCAVPL